MSGKTGKVWCMGILAALLVFCGAAVAVGVADGYEMTDASGQWLYALDEGEATLLGCAEAQYGDVDIPAELDGYPVTAIGRMAFADCTRLTGVIIPEGVAIISGEAFTLCYDLTDVIIPDSVTEIGEWAFKECWKLANLSIGNGVAYIGDSAFFGCEALTEVVLPDGVTSIGDYAFTHCISLENIVVPASVEFIGERAFHAFNDDYSEILPNENLTLYVKEGSYAEEYAQDNTLSCSTERFEGEDKAWAGRRRDGQWSYVLEDGCATIVDPGDNIDGHVIIPDEVDGYPVTAIDEYTFFSCYMLSSLTIPAGVTSLGKANFYDATLHVKRGSYAEEYAEENGYYFLYVDESGKLLYMPDEDEDGIWIVGYTEAPVGALMIPNELDGAPVIGIGENAFEECDGITEVIIPNSVTIIYDYAFSCCNNLVAVVIPQSVIDIGEDAFWDSEGFTLYVTEGSYAEEFAQESDIPYEYAEE